jgi:hypothetical protein
MSDVLTASPSPTLQPPLSDIFQALHGSIDAPSVIHQLLASTQSGDMHTAVYDFAANTMYSLSMSRCRAFNLTSALRFIGTARASNTSNGSVVLPAYARPFLSFNMTVLFNYKQ